MAVNISKVKFEYIYTIGNQAVPPAEGFSGPVDVAIADNDELYVACSYYEYPPARKFIIKCNMNEDYINYFGSYGEKDGQFMWPNSLAVDSAGLLYLSDEWLDRITVFDADGNFIKKIGISGSGVGEIHKPAGLDIDADGFLWVVDSGNHRIQKLTTDGELINSFGEVGEKEGQFNIPWGIKIGKDNNVYVADWRNGRVQKLDKEGNFLMSVGDNEGDGKLTRPSGVAIDEDGFIYVVDWGEEVVKVYNPAGEYVDSIVGDCHGYSKWAETRMASDPEGMAAQRAEVSDFTIERVFFQPTNIEIDSEGRILIVDCGRHRIQVYEKKY